MKNNIYILCFVFSIPAVAGLDENESDIGLPTVQLTEQAKYRAGFLPATIDPDDLTCEVLFQPNPSYDTNESNEGVDINLPAAPCHADPLPATISPC